MMNAVVAERELYQACRVIFGPDLNLSREFLDYIQLSGIKSAYRKRAMETHPDRFAANGNRFAARGELFCNVQQAYEKLCSYLAARERGLSFTRCSTPADNTASTPFHRAKKSHAASPPSQKNNREKHAQTTASSTDNRRPRRGTPYTTGQWDIKRFYRGPMPARPLLFGHYLYYSGIANWQTIAKALIWQRSQRPLFGEIGREYGWLTHTDVTTILDASGNREPFGKTAIRLGILDPDQVDSLLARQRFVHKKFGDYFTEHKLLSPYHLRSLLAKHQQHNASHSSLTS
jgi:hypothetical protein